ASVPREVFAGRAGVAVTGTPDGTVWVGTADTGLVRVAGGRTTRLTKDDAGLCTNFIWGLMTDAAGGVWMGGDHGPRANLCRLDPRAGGVRELGQAEGLDGEGVRVIVELPDGEIWVGPPWGLYRREREGARFSHVVLPDVRGQFETYDIHQARDGT